MSVAWCDTSTEQLGVEKRHTLSHLRLIDEQVTTFIDVDGCLRYMDELDEMKQLVLILSGSLGKSLVPRVCHRDEIRSIYIFCRRLNEHGNWAKQFPKVKGVFDQITELCRTLRSDKEQLEREQMGKRMIDPFVGASPCSSNAKQWLDNENPKSNVGYERMYRTEKSTETFNASSFRDVHTDRYIACSDTVVPYIAEEQQIEYSDTGKNYTRLILIFSGIL